MYRLPEDRVCVMGVLNATPDSFSDGGDFLDPARAIEHGISMFVDGADIVDVGGESTRPGAEPVPEQEEIARVVPVVEELAKRGVVSIDTSKPEVAALALDAGAKIVNDVSGFRNSDMVRVAVEHRVTVCVMHMKGDPHTMQLEPAYVDVVAEVREYLETQAAILLEAGLSRESVWLDPGIGFGKTPEHNLALLSRLPEIVEIGHPVLVGASRKSFIGTITHAGDPRRRLGGSLAAMAKAVQHGARIVRVHDVFESAQFLKIWASIS